MLYQGGLPVNMQCLRRWLGRVTCGPRRRTGAPRSHVPDFILGPPGRERLDFFAPYIYGPTRYDQLPAPAEKRMLGMVMPSKGFFPGSLGSFGGVRRGPFPYQAWHCAQSAPGGPGAGSGAGSVSISIVSGHTQAKSPPKAKARAA